jgi:hypothetical protein
LPRWHHTAHLWPLVAMRSGGRRRDDLWRARISAGTSIAYTSSSFSALSRSSSRTVRRNSISYLWNFFPVGMVDGDLVGEDYGFCQRWRSIGGRVWVDPAIQLAHIGHHIYTGDPMELFSTAPWAEAA